jgi:hypothetical protein
MGVDVIEKKNTLTLVVLSGDMDQVMAAYIIASGKEMEEELRGITGDSEEKSKLTLR